MIRHILIVGFALTSLEACAPQVPPASRPAETPTSETMDALFDSLTDAYVASLDEDRFRSRGMRRSLQKDLDALAREAGGLSLHAQRMNPSVVFLSRSLAEDARAAAQLFRSDDTEGSQRMIQHVTESCFACHTRLPSGSSADLSGRLLGSAAVQALPSHERVRLQVVARRFDTAMDGYEEILQSGGTAPQEIEIMGVLEEYLEICVRVRNDLDRAARHLETLLARPGLPPHLAAYVRVWRDDLMRLDGALAAGDELSRGRALIQEAMEKQDHFGSRRGLICSLVASSLLSRAVQGSASRPAEELAEAYYLLGVAEADISRLSLTSGLEEHLEKAIRTAPGSDAARSAYLFLEEYLGMVWSGSSGVRLPPDVRAHLEELHRLIGEF